MSHFEEIRKIVAAKRTEIDRGKDKGGAKAGAIQKAVLAHFDAKKPGKLDLDVAAATLLLLSYSSLESYALAPRWWIEARDPAFALEAMCRTLDFGRDGSFNPKDHVWIFEAKDAALHLREWEVESREHEWVSAAEDGFAVLREACAKDEASMAVAEKAYAKKPHVALRCALAYAMNRADWAREEALAAKKPDEPYYAKYLTWLFASLEDGAAAEALARVAPTDLEDSKVLDALASRLGAAAVPALAKLLERKCDAALAPLMSIRDASAAAALLSSLAIKSCGKRVLAYYTQSPEVAIAALSPVARDAKSKLQAAAKSALAAVRQAHPEAFDAKASAEVFGATAKTASASSVPAILMKPPWLEKPAERKAAPKEVKVNPTRVPIRADWRPGERDEWDEYGKDDHIAYYRERNKKPNWEAMAKKEAKSNTVDFFLMHEAPEAIALAVWNGLSDGQRLYYPNKWYGWSILGAIARRGEKFIPGLLALLKLKPSGAARMPIEDIIRVLVGFDGTEIADVLVDAYGSGKKVDAAAIAWAERRTETACLAAVPKAVAGSKSAIALLRDLVSRGKSDAIRAVAKRYKVQDALDAVVSTDPLRLFPPKLPKLPDFVRPDALPQILLEAGGALPGDAVTNLCTMLAFSTLDAPYAGIAEIRAVCTRESLRDFALALFESWLAVGAPPKESWAMASLGALAERDDEVVRRLVPLVRAWPGDGLSARAVAGLGVLEAIGTDLALSSIDGIAQKTKFQSIKQAAAERIAKIAARRGLSPEDLSDRLVPDLGLDEKGGLDLGPYRVVLDEQLEPHLVDSSGKAIKALPKTAKDEAARLKALKKDLKTVGAQRIARLEKLLVTQRTFPPDEFRLLFVSHPLMRQLARRLVWRTDENKTFRVDESGQYTNERDEAFTLAPNGTSRTVSVAHPLDLDEKTKTAWGQLFADYELLQPFPQLARETFARADLSRAIGKKLPAPKLVFGLERLGWVRYAAEDGGAFYGHFKPLTKELQAQVEYDGAVGMGYIEDKETLSIRSVDFSDGRRSVGLPAVDRIAMSEVLRDLLSL